MTPGTLVGGKYRLTRQIGTGAMGVVWAAVNESVGREVALKLIVQPHDELRRRLQLEGRACGAIQQKNVVRVFDMGETASGDPFLVMELLTGETLSELLKRKRRLDPAHAAQVARDVALALVAAHGASIIHRDLKPANIFLHEETDSDGTLIKTVKVLDFGVSKNLSPDTPDGLATTVGRVGSLAYMSPEQASRRGKLDPRSDLWSLGVVLFEMLTGDRPFRGEEGELMARILVEPIPLVSRFVRHIPPGLVTIVSRCLERDLGQRVQSAGELADLLKPYGEAQAAGVAPVAPHLSAPPAREARALTPPPLPPPPGAPAMDDDNAATERINPQALLGLMRQVTPPPLPAAPANMGAEMAGPPVLAKTAELGGYPLPGAPVAPVGPRPTPVPPSAVPSGVPAGPVMDLKHTIRMGAEYASQHAPFSPVSPTAAANGAVGWQAPPAVQTPVPTQRPSAPGAASTISPHLTQPAPSASDGRGAARSKRWGLVAAGTMVGLVAAAGTVVALQHGKAQAAAEGAVATAVPVAATVAPPASATVAAAPTAPAASAAAAPPAEGPSAGWAPAQPTGSAAAAPAPETTPTSTASAAVTPQPKPAPVPVVAPPKTPATGTPVSLPFGGSKPVGKPPPKSNVPFNRSKGI